MARAKKVYVAEDGEQFDSAVDAQRHDRENKLAPLIGYQEIGMLLQDIEDRPDVRDAIMAANNIVQEYRRLNGLVTPKKRPGETRAE